MLLWYFEYLKYICVTILCVINCGLVPCYFEYVTCTENYLYWKIWWRQYFADGGYEIGASSIMLLAGMNVGISVFVTRKKNWRQ